jgi:hypothetical protein
MDPVIVFRTFDLAEAQLVRGRLVEAGIDAEVLHENSAANLDIAGGGVRVTVPGEQAEDARELIQSTTQ